MKNLSLMIAAAGLLFAGSSAHAADRTLDAYLQRTTAQAAATLDAAGVEVPAQGLAVRAHVAGDGRLGPVQVIRSSGSLETDLRATQALRRLTVNDPPPGLVGAQVKLSLGASPIVQATAQ